MAPEAVGYMADGFFVCRKKFIKGGLTVPRRREKVPGRFVLFGIAKMPARKLLTPLIALVACAVLSACQTMSGGGVAAAPKPRPPLVLISIDALRYDYLERGLTPNLLALAADGATGPMRPSFPSLTFPNHYAMVTGLIPDHSGVIANYMYDPRHPVDPNDPRSSYFDKTKGDDGFWWQGAKPMWVSAEQAGIKTSSVFWPGTAAEIDHTRPSYVVNWTTELKGQPEVGQLLKWVDLPPAERPGVYLLYFAEVDEDGHHHGPDSAEVNASLQKIDGLVGQVVAGLKQRGIAANIVVVSDHGMIGVSPQQRTIYISDLLGKAELAPDAKTDPRYDLINWGSLAMFNPAPGAAPLLDKVLIQTPHDHMQCWHKADVPARLHFGKNPRVPQYVCLADPGWQVGGLTSVGTDVGNHGYDNTIPEMRAMFIANGPDIKAGVKLPVFDNVDVYDLEMKLIGLKPEPNDGTLAPLRPALK
jgi:predicted AlkP superfamily pyrophosphatase or phosphodiesterase